MGENNRTVAHGLHLGEKRKLLAELRRTSKRRSDYATIRRQLSEISAGSCFRCGKRDDGSFVVDHDHRTGFIRALLCTSCNVKLGVVENRAQEAEQRARYEAWTRSFGPPGSALPHYCGGRSARDEPKVCPCPRCWHWYSAYSWWGPPASCRCAECAPRSGQEP